MSFPGDAYAKFTERFGFCTGLTWAPPGMRITPSTVSPKSSVAGGPHFAGDDLISLELQLNFFDALPRRG
jgi:hypothetical protein